MDIVAPTENQTRIQRLKASTDEAHKRLDAAIMAAQPFASRERYTLFLDVQYRFHADVAPLYHAPELGRLLPDLAARCRFEAIGRDIADLTGMQPSKPEVETGGLDLPAALGWLYVSEGSNLGAAFLIKEAAKLGLSEQFGARHLAGHPDGRGLHWRMFVDAFNRLDVSPGDEDRVVEGAQSAFRRVHSLVERIFA